MRGIKYRNLWTVLLCIALLFTDVTSAGSLVFAAQEETPLAETEETQTGETENQTEAPEMESGEEEEAGEAIKEPETEKESGENESSQDDPAEREDSAEAGEGREQEGQEEQEPAAEETEAGQDGEFEEQSGQEEEAGEDEAETVQTEESPADAYQTEAEQMVALSSDDIASGSYKKITWVIDVNGKLTVAGTGDIKCAGCSYGIAWYEYRTSIKSAEIRVTGATDLSRLFYGCSNLTSVNLSGLHAENIAGLSSMFFGCKSLTSLDLSSFNTRNVTNMENMFYDCSSLTSLDLSSFDTRNVTSMNGMFKGCSSLESLNLSSFDTVKVAYIQCMFEGCSGLSSLDVNNFNTRNVTVMHSMFSGCSSLRNLDLSNFDTRNVTNMQDMFHNCSSLTSLDLSSFDTRNVTDMIFMFSGCSSLSSFNISSFDTRNVTGMQYMFSGCSSLTSLDLSNFDTQYVTKMSLMFSGCSSLTSLNVSSFDIRNVTDMQSMFRDCSSLTNLNLSSFNTSNVTDMTYMFSGCNRLSSLNVDSFDTLNVVKMDGMFWGCSSLTSLDLNSFDIRNATSLSFMFRDCSSLTSLDLSGFDTRNVIYMSEMFKGCSSLMKLDLSGFDTQNVNRMGDMFYNCSSLASLNLSSFYINPEDFDAGDMFYGCSALSTIYAPCALKLSVELPRQPEFNEEWRLPNGAVVTELPQNLTRSVVLRKYQIVDESPDEGSSDGQLKYVQKLTQVSLKNADAESKESIQNAIYNLLFKAEYRPIYSKIPGDTMAFTGTWDAIVRWPVQNKDYGTPVFWASTVTDAKLGTIRYNIASAGCMSYACFAATYIYGTCGQARSAAAFDGNSVRDFIRSYADPGEQLRYYYVYGDYKLPHSIVFLGEDADGDGFYYISYNGGDDGAGGIYHDLYVGSYARYADFAAVIAPSGIPLQIYDTNNGSYYNSTAASAANVRGGNGAAKIVTRLACPIEATVALNGEVLDSRNPGTTSFGTVAREGGEVVFTLGYSPDYKLTVIGTGEGGMTLTLEYYNEAETLIDRRKFVNIPIQADTAIESGGFDAQASFVLHKSDGNGEAEAWGAGINETVYGADNSYRGDSASTPDNIRIITFDANGGTIDGEAVTVIATDDDGMLAALPTAVRDGYTFKGWYTSKIHGIKVDETRIYMENTTLYAQWEKTGADTPEEDQPESDIPAEDIPEGGIPNGLWIAGISDMSYTGCPIKPEVRVYDSNRRLREGKDYTISYKNNTKAVNSADSSKPATVLVKGKGNFAGTETATFNILPVNLADSSVTAQELTVAYNGRVQKKAVTVMFNGKKLSAGKDFTVSYPALAQGTSGAFQEAGTYDILLTAKAGGNFSGTRTVKLTVTKATLISKVSVKKIPNQQYTGEAVMPKPVVTYRKDTLTENIDYTISYENNVEAGTAAIVLTGTGAYAGTKKVIFQILGTPLKNLTISGIENRIYNGAEQTLNLSIQAGGVTLKKDIDYELLYVNNINAGKASVTIKGINAYTGVIKKTFQIAAYDMKENAGNRIEGLDGVMTAKYLKGGSRLALQLTFAGRSLIEGKDYTLSYKNNKAVTSANTVRKPAITIKGKGNFKGTVTKTFMIVSKSFDDPEVPVTMSVADRSFTDRAGKYISAPELTDADGKKLAAGTDYEKAVIYALEDGTVLTGKSKVPADTNVVVTVRGKGAYSGELKMSYRITKCDFNKATIRISPQIYTGKKITLNQDSIIVKIGRETLTYGTDYEIVEGSYVNNTEKGTAKVKIIGKGSYGGSKNVQFRITARKFSWFFRLFQ